MKAWFVGGGWIVVAGALVVLGLVTATVVLGAGQRRRYAPRHLSMAVEYDYTPRAQDFYGAATLEDERAWYGAPEVAHSGWYGQTAADLSPEALDAWGPLGPSESYAAWLAEGTDSGPGDSLVGPGPDLEDEDEQTAMDVRWLQSADQHQPRLADRRSAVSQMSQVDDGPDTARLAWLDQQLAAHADWARRMRGQVTGWGLEAAA